MLNKSKLAAVGLLLGVFASGAVVGGGASAAFGDRPSDERSRRDGRDRGSYADRLQRDLNLTVAQREQIETILATYSDSMDAFWTEVRPRLHGFRARIREDIAAALDDAQRETYGAMNDRSDSARAARERGGRHGR